MKELYVILSRTETGFGRAIRRFTKCYYNHSAISFEPELRYLYSFSRRAYDLPLSASLVRETAEMYTLSQKYNPDIAVFCIPLPERTFRLLRRSVYLKYRDGDYLYNIPSACSWPILKGCATPKAHTCSEFTASVLRQAGIYLSRPDYTYHPEDFYNLLSEYLIYQGGMLDYPGLDYLHCDPAFFQRHTPLQALQYSLPVLSKLAQRCLFRG